MAPYDSGSPDATEVATAVWVSLQAAIGKVRRRNEGLLVLVDANAQLYGPPVAADFALPSRRFVDEMGLGDLGQISDGGGDVVHHVTYQTSLGVGHQLDYMLASCDFVGEEGCPSAADSIVPFVDCLDHLPHAVGPTLCRALATTSLRAGRRGTA